MDKKRTTDNTDFTDVDESKKRTLITQINTDIVSAGRKRGEGKGIGKTNTESTELTEKFVRFVGFVFKKMSTTKSGKSVLSVV